MTETQMVDVLNEEWFSFLENGFMVYPSEDAHATNARLTERAELGEASDEKLRAFVEEGGDGGGDGDGDGDGKGKIIGMGNDGNDGDGDRNYNSHSDAVKSLGLAKSSATRVSGALYISTKTVIIYMNTKLNLEALFWECPIIDYFRVQQGVVKKQMKITSTSYAEIDAIEAKLGQYSYHNTKVIAHVNKGDGALHDVRKINIGMSKKDISASSKYNQKGAFYNCFVVTLRVFMYERFHEVHIKAFNSGNIEIPGIKDAALLDRTVEDFSALLRGLGIVFAEAAPFQRDTILINSNFYCGYDINRETLYRVLVDKYKITCWYDSCSYPGIQCKYYCYDDTTISAIRDDGDIQRKPGQKHRKHPQCKDVANKAKIYEVSFFVFRTGNVLIVGRCTERVLEKIYGFIRTVLEDECDKVKTPSTRSAPSRRQDQPRQARYNRLNILVSK